MRDRLLTAAAVALLVLGPACGDGNDDGDTSGDDTQPTQSSGIDAPTNADNSDAPAGGTGPGGGGVESEGSDADSGAGG